jgi:hypothetical protein
VDGVIIQAVILKTVRRSPRWSFRSLTAASREIADQCTSSVAAQAAGDDHGSRF